ncbi:hypothetical protein [Thermoactinospora rubra]|uniref:hypothetical protein n=1 Tax=Thermoactinospora rubra TaxID=1088767 RepID=UPI000A102139|nr:hypothetical protein [Thermoactinospora rubra]
MRIFLWLAALLCLVQGVGAVVDNVWGEGGSWFLVNRLPFLEGYEVYAGIVVGVLGLALGALARSGAERGK